MYRKICYKNSITLCINLYIETISNNFMASTNNTPPQAAIFHKFDHFLDKQLFSQKCVNFIL